MSKMMDKILEAREIYGKGGNVINFLKNEGKDYLTSTKEILISYDLQAGTYIENFLKEPQYYLDFAQALAKVLNSLGSISSIAEAGIGEGTTLGLLVKNLDRFPQSISGFDLSWSRVKFANKFLENQNLQGVQLFAADLFRIPLMNNAVDVLYTAHSVEPNGGREKEALQELYRVAGKYLILLEPSYELGSVRAKSRIKQQGYITKLYDTAKSLGYKVVEYRLFDVCFNELNPTALLIIEKKQDITTEVKPVCPITLTPLFKYKDSLLYSRQSGLGYPVIDNLPCLLPENAILATHLLTDFKDFFGRKKISYE